MTIGLIARADNSGLGAMAWEFARHIKFDQIMLKSNGRYKTYPDRFYNLVDDLTCDIVVSIETFYDYKKKEGQKTILLPMYECSPVHQVQGADKIINVSLLDQRIYPQGVYLPWPVNRTVLPFKLRREANTFIHNAGHGGLGGRNGTKELIEALAFTTADFKLIIQSQIPVVCKDPRVEVRVQDLENYWELWTEGDVFIFPEKFNGLSLPIQEAMSVGMPIMCTNRFPFNAYLPRPLMIEPSGYKPEMIARRFEAAIVEPKKIAEAIDTWAGMNIVPWSKEMNQLAGMMSWDKLKTKWEKEIYAT